jgi:hypothetical protein
MRLMTVLLFMVFSFSNMAFADLAEPVLNEEYLLQEVESQVDTGSTCLDDYLKRQAQVRKFLIWAPPTTVVAAPAAFMVGGYTAAFISSTLLQQGWAALGYTILGAFGSGVGVIGTFIVLETSRGIEYANNNKMLELIAASHAQEYKNKRLMKFTKRFNEKYAEKEKSVEEIAQIVSELDTQSILCNGEARGIKNPKNLKYSLAKQRHLLKYIANGY